MCRGGHWQNFSANGTTGRRGELDSVNSKSESGQRTFERLTFYCFPVFFFPHIFFFFL